MIDLVQDEPARRGVAKARCIPYLQLTLPSLTCTSSPRSPGEEPSENLSDEEKVSFKEGNEITLTS